MQPPSKWVLYLDLLKVLSCFWVIVNHTLSPLLYGYAPSPTWLAAVTYFFLSKPAVSLFLMASGAVLLGRAEGYRKGALRWLRMAAVLGVASFCYDFLVYQNFAFNAAGLAAFFKLRLKTRSTQALWYLYLYLGILLMLPLLQRMIRSFVKKDYLYFIGVTTVLLGTLPILSHYTGWTVSTYFTAPIFSAYLGVYVAGYYIHRFAKPNFKGCLTALLILVLLLAGQVVGTYAEYSKNPQDFLFFDTRNLIPITGGAMCLFYMAKYVLMAVRLPGAVVRGITRVSRCTFGIYLLADGLILWMAPLRQILDQATHPLVGAVLFQGAIFVAGFGIVYGLRKIPLVAKIL